MFVSLDVSLCAVYVCACVCICESVCGLMWFLVLAGQGDRYATIWVRKSAEKRQ